MIFWKQRFIKCIFRTGGDYTNPDPYRKRWASHHCSRILWGPTNGRLWRRVVKPEKERGQKKKSKGGSSSSATLKKGKTPSRKRDIMKKQNCVKAMKSEKVKPPKKQQSPESSETGPKSERKSKQPATEEPKPKKSRASGPGRVYQDRVDLGNGKWRYAILDCQWYGCSNCRFIYNGCATCQNPLFKGKTADIVRAEYEKTKGRSSKDPSKSTSLPKKKKNKSKWRIYGWACPGNSACFVVLFQCPFWDFFIIIHLF